MALSTDRTDVADLRDLIADASQAVVFTGAGISTESGIPDFRSPGGIWDQYKPIQFQDFVASDEMRREYWRRKFKIGYWKVKVARRYPGKLLHDSHTPQILKVQILLGGLAGLCLLGGFLQPLLFWGLGISGVLFLLTTVPFALKAWSKDPLAAAVSPGLLLVRALALGTGFAAGLVTSIATNAPAGEQQDA